MTRNSADRAIRFAVIGFGGIGRWHAKQIRSLPGIELVAVADPDDSALREATRFSGVGRFSDAKELLRLMDIDVVSICTPPDTHLALVEVAAAEGRHVLVEKPLGLTLAQVDRCIAVCARAGVALGVVHQQRTPSATRALQRLLSEGDFGTPLVAAAIHTWWRTGSAEGGPFRGDAGRGGGLLLDQAVHAIDLLVFFLGRPEWVSGMPARRDDSSAEHSAVATIGFPRGAMATLTASSAVNCARDDIAIELAGTRGAFRLEIRDYDHAEITRLDLSPRNGERARSLSPSEIESLVVAESGRWRRGPTSPLWRSVALLADRERGRKPFRSIAAILRRRVDRAAQLESGEPQGHAAILARMGAVARGKARPLVSGEDARAAAAIIDGIVRSDAESGRRVDLTSLWE